MKLGKLYENFTTPNSGFLNLFRNQDLSLCETLEEVKETMQQVFEAADDYAEANHLSHKYFDLAKRPLLESIEIESRHFIIKGFDARIAINLSESIENIKPYVVIANNDIEKFDINQEFVESLIPLHRELFLKELSLLEQETVDSIKKVWKLEQQRIDKWLKHCKVVLNGEKK